MRVLITTKIFPNSREPTAAPYNRHQFVALSERCDVRLLASIPWFPGQQLVGRVRGKSSPAAIEHHTSIDGMGVSHPRVLYLPKVGQSVAGFTYAGSLLPHVVAHRGRVDVVLAAFAYPDGFAGVLLARALGVPCVIKVHGSDINVLSQAPHLRPLLSWALSRAYAVVGPSQALVDQAVSLGANPETSRCLLNGVDKSLFHVRDAGACRERLGLDPQCRWVVFVGRLEPQKGCAELLEAFARLSQEADAGSIGLVLVGDGVAAGDYRAQAESAGLNVRFPGACAHAEVADWLGAAHVLALPSWNEGTPNVVIEALVSGRPVVATRVGGIPAVVDRPLFGQLCEAKDTDGLVQALRRVLDDDHDTARIADEVAFGDWSDSAGELHELLERAVESHGGAERVAS